MENQLKPPPSPHFVKSWCNMVQHVGGDVCLIGKKLDTHLEDFNLGTYKNKMNMLSMSACIILYNVFVQGNWLSMYNLAILKRNWIASFQGLNFSLHLF